MYFPPLLGRISTVAGSKCGSNCRTISVRVCAKWGCALPMTLMGKSLGYSIRDCSGGISCIVVAQPLKRRNGLVVTGAQCSIYGAGLALAHRLAVSGGNGHALLGCRRQHRPNQKERRGGNDCDR